MYLQEKMLIFHAIINDNYDQMLKSIEIKNFFSFQCQRIELNPKINVLVGINGAGKSNLFKAIRVLRAAVTGNLRTLIYDHWGGQDNIQHKGREVNSESVEITYEFDSGFLSRYGFYFKSNVFYTITIKRQHGLTNYYLKEKVFQPKEKKDDWIYLEFNNGVGVASEKEPNKTSKPKLQRYEGFDPMESALVEISDPDRYYPLSTIKKAISDWVIYEYLDTTPKSQLRRPQIPTSEKRLTPDGSNLTQALNTLKINDRDNYYKVIDLLKAINPLYVGIDYNFIGGNIELLLEEEGLKSPVHVSHISDGTLIFLALLSILYNPKRGGLVCIDEPDNGLHPDMINTVAQGIKSAAVSDSSQLIIATHSPLLLNAFELEDVLVFEKGADNATSVKNLFEEDFEDWVEEFLPGRMWLQGLLGGVRYGR